MNANEKCWLLSGFLASVVHANYNRVALLNRQINAASAQRLFSSSALVQQMHTNKSLAVTKSFLPQMIKNVTVKLANNKQCCCQSLFLSD